MSRPARAVVLAEDQRQQSLVRRYLKGRGYTTHDMRLVGLPSGRGSGEQWVRERYAAEVAEYRSRTARAGTVLIVAIDADNFEVRRRDQQLREALTEHGEEERRAGEKIVHLIPKRHVETWILCLQGETVDEGSDYRNRAGVDGLIRGAAETLFDWSRANANVPPRCTDSLRLAFVEVRRLES